MVSNARQHAMLRHAQGSKPRLLRRCQACQPRRWHARSLGLRLPRDAPALPLRCRACALEMGTTCKESAPVRALYERAFTKPGSTTYRTPGTVIEVSAMLVASITCMDKRLVIWLLTQLQVRHVKHPCRWSAAFTPSYSLEGLDQRPWLAARAAEPRRLGLGPGLPALGRLNHASAQPCSQIEFQAAPLAMGTRPPAGAISIKRKNQSGVYPKEAHFTFRG